MQSVLQIQRYRADWRSTKMQSILQIPEIKSRWEINQDAEHPTDPGDIEQTGDQPKCRASYKSRIYKVDGRSTKMQSILQIKDIYRVDWRSTKMQSILQIMEI